MDRKSGFIKYFFTIDAIVMCVPFRERVLYCDNV